MPWSFHGGADGVARPRNAADAHDSSAADRELLRRKGFQCGIKGLGVVGGPDRAYTSHGVSGSGAFAMAFAMALADGASRSSRKERSMWTKPEYTEMRFGFEVTMYIATR
jgi:coenzyme PQQ precursor peptide PqqA